MIDWEATKLEFGYGVSILSQKRPLVICRCDICNKSQNIKIRNKSRVVDKQIEWLCPACVKKKDSDKISVKMRELWKNNNYRDNQMNIKSSSLYKEKQSISSKARWNNATYRSKLQTGLDKSNYITRSIDNHGDIYDYTDTRLVRWHDRIEVVCKKCNNVLFKDPQKHLIYGYCKYCCLTKGQREINEYINSLGFNTQINTRDAIKNKELDIFVPSNNLGIEYHGLFWHSFDRLESSVERKRHQEKSLICMEANIKLMQFFDFEWINKKDIIKSMIANSLSPLVKYDARKLKIQELSDNDARIFFTSNHLLGYRSAKLVLALVDETDIHCAISFSKVKGGYEIIRLATGLNRIVRGGASKILSHFSKFHSGYLFSFADLRYSYGNVYHKLGFRQIRITPPGYFYSKQSNLHCKILSRQQCQKVKLKNLLGSSFDPALSESQNMFNNGFRRVWTAGNILFVKSL